MPLNIDNTKTEMAIPPILRLAFRPLFLLGTLFSVITIGWWVHFWSAPFQWAPYGGVLWWHGHEMLFGFGVAIVTGFLLTAVKTWTSVPGIRGKWLAGLVLTWVSGRLLISFSSGINDWLIASVDIAYLVLSAIAMAYPVFKVKQWRNLMFVPILLTLAGLNVISHWAVNTNQPVLAMHSLHATIMLFTLIISILGGRVIPAFTANTTGQKKATPIMGLEIVSILSILSMITIAFIGFDRVDPKWLSTIALITAITNGIRFMRWGIQHTGSIPLLWSLHLSYIFIPLGFALISLNAAGLMNNISAALHSFTIGAIGGMILAMISRVTLGHTGRPLKAHPMINWGFVSIIVATLVRVVLPTWLPEYYSLSISLAGILWILAFGLFLIFYTPMLVKKRADGQIG